MEFIQIKISDRDYPKRLNRTIALRPDLNLNDVGFIIGNTLGTSRIHFFMFRSGNKEFVDESWIGQFKDNPNEYDLKESHLSDLDEKFEYIYDTGEDYEFKCSILKKRLDIDTEGIDTGLVARTLKAKGLGIFEDNHGCLDEYFDGKIDPEATRGEYEFDLLPWNLDMKKFGDYEKEIDLELFDVYETDLRYLRNPDDEIDDFYDDDFDDGSIDPAVRELFLREMVAMDIFEDIDINAKYRKLILKYDINDAYEMIVKCMIEAHEQGEAEDLDEDEVDHLYYEAVEDLD